MRIELNNLTKSYDKPVLCGIDLDDDFSALALIGRSGCGKSTLLRILGGLVAQTSGTSVIDSMPVSDSVEHRRRMGFVFQQSGLFSHINALRNITLPLTEVHGFTKKEAEERAYELLIRFGLKDEALKLPSQLSGGQKQRISIARAVAPRPKLLLLDEPTSALDPEYTSEVLNMVNELKNDNMSLIIATHEMGFALHSCDKLAFMHEGLIAEYGNAAELFSAPRTEMLKSFLAGLLQWKV